MQLDLSANTPDRIVQLRAAQLLVGLFTTALLLTDVVVVEQLNSAVAVPSVIYLGLTFGQLALAAIWCVRGRSFWLLRWVATLMLACGLARGWTRVTYAGWDQWLAVLLLYTVIVALGCKGAPLIAGAVRRFGALTGSCSAGSIVPRWSRWSLGGMLSVMTCAGIVLGPGRWITFPWQQAGVIAGHLTALVTVAAISIWSISAPLRFRVRVGMISAASLLAGLLMSRVDSSFSAWHYALACLLAAALLCFGHDILFLDQKSWRST